MPRIGGTWQSRAHCRVGFGRGWQVVGGDVHIHLSVGEGESSTRTTSRAEEGRAGLEDEVGSHPLLRSCEGSRNMSPGPQVRARVGRRHSSQLGGGGGPPPRRVGCVREFFVRRHSDTFDGRSISLLVLKNDLGAITDGHLEHFRVWSYDLHDRSSVRDDVGQHVPHRAVSFIDDCLFEGLNFKSSDNLPELKPSDPDPMCVRTLRVFPLCSASSKMPLSTDVDKNVNLNLSRHSPDSHCDTDSTSLYRKFFDSSCISLADMVSDTRGGDGDASLDPTGGVLARRLGTRCWRFSFSLRRLFLATEIEQRFAAPNAQVSVRPKEMHQRSSRIANSPQMFSNIHDGFILGHVRHQFGTRRSSLRSAANFARETWQSTKSFALVEDPLMMIHKSC